MNRLQRHKTSSAVSNNGGEVNPTREDHLLRSNVEDKVAGEDGTIATIEQLYPNQNRQSVRTTMHPDEANPEQIMPTPPTWRQAK